MAEVLGIIPARGGSKGVPRKNVRLMAGKPLIAWTIGAALAAERVTRVVVSTDDEEIAEVSKAAGAEIIWRPEELAQDTSPTEPAMLHVLGTLEEREGYDPAVTVLLQCTSPLRDAETIDTCVEKVLAGSCEVCMTVTESQHWVFSGTLDGDLFRPRYDYDNRPRTQDTEKRYHENGACYATKTSLLRERGNRLGGVVRVVVMHPMESADIDSDEDFVAVERAMTGYRAER